jgi:hypothetical protein
MSFKMSILSARTEQVSLAVCSVVALLATAQHESAAAEGTKQTAGSVRAGPAALAAALRDVPVFKSGSTRRPPRGSPHETVKFDAPARGVESILSKHGLTSTKFTLNARHPYIEGKGFIQVDNADDYDTMTNNIAISGNSSAEVVFVVVFATAGQTYLIDEAVAGSAGSCQFTVQGPDGQQNSYPCGKSAWTQQHLVYAYAASVSGEAWFSTTVSKGASGVFSTITVAPVE